MQVTVYQRKTCRLCDGRKVELVVSLAPTPVAEKYVTKEQSGEDDATYPLDLYMCRDCSHVQLLDVVDPQFVFDSYTYSSSNTSGIVKHFEMCVDKIVSHFKPAPKALAVDIGSNDGSLLRSFQKRSLRVLGVDPAKEIAQKATQSGVETLAEFLSLDLARNIKQTHGPASIVTAFNVFAHADDLGGMADSIRELLAPNGVFVFEVSYLLDVIDRMLLGTIFHEHLSYHSVKPMREFLWRHGMELIDVERVTIQGGSFIGTAQLVGGPHSVSSSVGELLALEQARGLDQPDTVKEFTARMKKVKDELGGMLVGFKRQGMTIAGYGAARSGTTLISQMDLGNVLSFIVDDSPEKQNKLSPGHHIPVLPTKAMYERRPEYVFILAWIHAKKIIENNRKYLEQGGHFVVCFPEVKVIGKEHLVET